MDSVISIFFELIVLSVLEDKLFVYWGFVSWRREGFYEKLKFLSWFLIVLFFFFGSSVLGLVYEMGIKGIRGVFLI